MTGTRHLEVKAMDYPQKTAGSDVVTALISTTVTYDGLNLVTEGTSFYNRVGRRIRMKSVTITGSLARSANTVTTGGEYLRVLLIYDRQPNGNFPGPTDVLLDYGADGTTGATSFSGMNMNNVERFAILRDKRIAVVSNDPTAGSNGATVASVTGTVDPSIYWHVKLKDLETHYKGNTTPQPLIGDIATGALILMTIGDVANTGCAYELQWKSRLRFVDL